MATVGDGTRVGVARRTRWLPVLSVLVAAPWFAELSWGGYPLTDLPLIVLFLGPLYGGAALLIREFARRTGRGWPTILLLGAAFGVLQAGLVDQSLFNPQYGRYDFQHPVHLEVPGLSLYHLVSFVTGHAVASIATPLALAEGWSRRGREPWLGRVGLTVVALAYLLAAVVNHLGVKDEEGAGFQASPLQVLVASTAVLVLVAAAVLRRRRPGTGSVVPSPVVLAVFGFGAYLLYLPGENAAALVCAVVVITCCVLALGHLSRSRDWGPDHTLALALGVVLVGVVVPFWADPYDDRVAAGAEFLADVGAAGVSLAVVAATLLRRRYLLRHTSPAA